MNDGNTLINEESVGHSEPIVFFNYHEYLITDYKLKEGLSLIGNHFPNNYVSNESEIYHRTRIIRIPRVYESNKYSDIIPQFSSYCPGDEPAALKSDQIQSYTPAGEFENNHFGSTSATPLSPRLISKEDFEEIINMVNKLLFEAFNPHSISNFFDNSLDLLTGGMYSKIFCKLIIENYSKRKLYELEKYIDNDINPKLMQINPLFKVISPRDNGYLSVSI